MSKTGKMTKKMSRVLMIVSAVLLVGAVLTACGVAGLFNMPALELPTDTPIVEETPIVDPSLPSADGSVEIPEKPVLKEEDKIKPDYNVLGAGEAHLPSLNAYGQYDGYGVYNWGQLSTMIADLENSLAKSATYVIGIDLVADSTIIIPTGTNITLTSITNITGDRKSIRRKVIKDASNNVVDPEQLEDYVFDSLDYPNIQTTVRNASFTGSMFYIESGATLTIQHLELNGSGDEFINSDNKGVYSCYSLVMTAPRLMDNESLEKSACLYLEQGSVLTKNNMRNTGKFGTGAGVFANAGSVFIMNDGEISDMRFFDKNHNWQNPGDAWNQDYWSRDVHITFSGCSVYVGRENICLQAGMLPAGSLYTPLPGLGYAQFFFNGGNITRNTRGSYGVSVAYAGQMMWDGGRISYNSCSGWLLVGADRKSVV